ncbi:TPA: hypothetical protein OL416_000517 [Clostridioides difficile]|uniref:hypothetical protein n=1 Tax=Clostridioides difficile TaxID=1496 RepID=UPI00155A52CE|nr:hypothetical protein [Clostridioides difficile]EJA6601980.1 hypothetical protein [Clostridioides difficile]EJA6889996.1 hypothetical protein [Clostridioides difficile]EJX3379315.1 hypothetical protein [Clostridioides difficile]MBF9881216.1 hypothetical protein [Clostridioides difficile]MBF9917221.1 hypothetical protein [Clostridioides difficile]
MRNVFLSEEGRNGFKLVFRQTKLFLFSRIPCNFNLLCLSFSIFNFSINSFGADKALFDFGVFGSLKDILPLE